MNSVKSIKKEQDLNIKFSFKSFMKRNIALIVFIVFFLLGCENINTKGNITALDISNNTRYIMVCEGLNGTEHPIMTDENGKMKWWECKELCNSNPGICQLMIDKNIQ